MSSADDHAGAVEAERTGAAEAERKRTMYTA